MKYSDSGVVISIKKYGENKFYLDQLAKSRLYSPKKIKVRGTDVILSFI